MEKTMLFFFLFLVIQTSSDFELKARIGPQVPYSFKIVPSEEGELLDVTVHSGNLIVDQYKAYAVKNMSIAQYLASPEEIKKASILAQGRFAFPKGHGITEKDEMQAFLYSDYAYQVACAREKSISKRFAQSGGHAHMENVRSYYETLRPVYNKILEENPGLGNSGMARKLNELGYNSSTGKAWRDTNVQRLKLYLTGDPAFELAGKEGRG